MSFIAIGFRASILLMIIVVIFRKRFGSIISFLEGVVIICFCLAFFHVTDRATVEVINMVPDYYHTSHSNELISKVPRPILEHIVFGNNTAGFYAAVTGSPVDFRALGNFTVSTVHSGVQAVSLLLSEDLDVHARDIVLQFLATNFGVDRPYPRTKLAHPRFREVLEAHMARAQ